MAQEHTLVAARPAAQGQGGNARMLALRELVERTLAGLGYELVELERAGHGLLRVTLDCLPGVASSGQGMPGGAPDADAGLQGAPADAQGGDAQDAGAEGDAAGAERQIRIEDCERVSRHLTHLFAVEEIDYDRLEVSSPGIDRPLRGARDFARFAGSMVKVQLFSAADGRKRLRGRLLGLVAAEGEGAARVRMCLVPEAPAPLPRGVRRPRARAPQEGATVEFALADVEKARLAPDWEFDREALARGAARHGGPA